MEETNISSDILLRKIRQQLTAEEETIFQLWFCSDKRHELYFERMKTVWLSDENTLSLQSDLPRVIAQFDEYVRHERSHRRKYRIRRFYRYAAVVILLLCVGGGSFLWFRNQPDVEEFIPLAEKILPGSKKAVLVFADGKRIAIDRLPDSTTYDLKGIEIEKQDGLISYKNARQDSDEYHTIEIPRGGEYQVLLSDGTKIWLNAETQLRIPKRFTDKERRVFLSGEAYFDVTKDASRPFIVETDLGCVKVYGTEFNVQRYLDENQLKATLVEGSIGFNSDMVPDLKIKPGYQLCLTEGQSVPEIRKVKVYNEISWKNKQFCFQSKKLSEIMTSLKRWYDVEVVFADPELEDLIFSGTLNRYDEISALLRLFEAGYDIRFVIEDNTIKIMKK